MLAASPPSKSTISLTLSPIVAAWNVAKLTTGVNFIHLKYKCLYLKILDGVDGTARMVGYDGGRHLIDRLWSHQPRSGHLPYRSSLDLTTYISQLRQ